jgi:hypothetical protein
VAASGNPYILCTPDGGSGCSLIYQDEDWSKGGGDAASIIVGFNSDAEDTSEPFLSFQLTRNASFIEVYFNYTDFPGASPSVSCTGNYPSWAADGTGWVHGGSSIDVTLLSDPSRVRRFGDRQMSNVPAGTIVTLGPNDIPGCPAGFQPLMYFVRIYAP